MPQNQKEFDCNQAGGLYDSDLDHDSCGIGFVVNTHGVPQYRILEHALHCLANVVHRGAVGADGLTADGSGLLCDIPRGLLQQWLAETGSRDQSVDDVAIAKLFLPQDSEQQQACIDQLAGELQELEIEVCGTRTVPIDISVVGPMAAKAIPEIRQLFARRPTEMNVETFERMLYLVCRKLKKWASEQGMEDFSIASFSGHNVVYKGLVIASRLADFYPDLKDERFASRYCLYHQRFSTNTTPRWSLCQPFQMLAHNGEINTVRGNRNWMNARQPSMEHPLWGDQIDQLFPITSHDESDSSSLNNALQLLRHSGRELLQSMLILMPPAWQAQTDLSPALRNLYEYQSCFSEPWDGPAAIAFTDGKIVAACLDRNGLRPARYKLFDDGIFVVGSEVGADKFPLEQTASAGRLAPGQMVAVDLDRKQVLFDDQIKQTLAAKNDYGSWLAQHRIRFNSTGIGRQDPEQTFDAEELRRHQIVFGLTQEDRDIVIRSMVETGKETTFSMGLDTPLAVLSRRPQLLSRYFKQRFAQVTNPPIDSIREKNVMSVAAGLGPERNLLQETPQHCKIIAIDHPILFEHELAQITQFEHFPCQTIECRYERAVPNGLQQAIESICEQAVSAVQNGSQIIKLSDRNFDSRYAPVPMLLAVGAVHHRLCQTGLRMKFSLIADTASVWGPHQISLLFGYGATAICPYLALQTAVSLETQPVVEALRYYRDAIENGLRKIMAKMGISVLNSYQGAQIFEAVGIHQEVIDVCFCGTRSAIAGTGFAGIQKDSDLLHGQAFQQSEGQPSQLDHEGRYKPKKDGVRHLITGHVTKSLHRFVREGNQQDYDSFSQQVSPDDPYSIRDLLEFRTVSQQAADPQVESIESIRRRFTTAAMSLGAISPEAHEAIAVAMNSLGGKSNSGEGGEDIARNEPRSGQDARSKIKQVASGRFGVTTPYLMSADEIEIKMAQGAKPGEGGQLPGFKVNPLIAKLRHTDPGVSLISPPPHHDIYSIEDLSQLIFDLKCVNPNAIVSVKLVAKSGVGNIAVGVAKANADVILISGHEGGTGASPLSSINHAGIPWEIGLAETHQALVENGLRDHVILRADGGLKTGRDVMIAAILGAQEFNFGTMALMSLGCVYVKKCHLNNCPVGIATQDEKYRSKFKGEPEHLVRYINGVADEVQKILTSLGRPSIDDVVGCTSLLYQRQIPNHDKANRVTLERLLPPSEQPFDAAAAQIPVVKCFDDSILDEITCKIEKGESIELKRQVVNTDRNIGSRLSGFVCQAIGQVDGPDPLVQLELEGSAGQSLGAFLVDGISIRLTGEANDYVGKSLCGGTIVVRPVARLLPACDQHVMIGNTCLYGATSGSLFVAGQAAERFAIRNSGATAVVEGCGEHGCEYMTRGTVLILGSIGGNFGAGMTGGQVFVFDPDDGLSQKINRESVRIEELNKPDLQLVSGLLARHLDLTGSGHARKICIKWETMRHKFRKVVPLDPTTPSPPHFSSGANNKVSENPIPC